MDTMLEHGISSDEQLNLGLITKCTEVHISVMKKLLEGAQFSNPVLYSVEQAAEMVNSGNMQLWLVLRGIEPELFFLTQIIQFPAGKVVDVCLVAGKNMEEAMAKFHENFIFWCKSQGAIMISSESSQAAARVLRKWGFVPTAIKMHRSLITHH